MTRALVTDTSSSITPEIAEELGIHLIPMDIIFEYDTYKDGYDLSLEEFYVKMEEESKKPSTSQPPVGEFIEIYEKLVENYDEILSIHPGSQLSGTVKTAQMAANQVDAAKITIFDSEVVSILTAYQVLEAKRLMDEGKTMDSIIKQLEDMKAKTLAFVMVDDFTHLSKSGRIQSAAGKFMSFTKIKPILSLSTKGIKIIRTVRTSKRALNKIEQLAFDYIESLDYPVQIDVAHGNIPKVAKKVRECVVEKYSEQKSKLLRLAGVIGAHSGPGVVGITIAPDYSKM